jgi:uncharacterized membrane protein YeaQ/YmgE (transglycosylase-associated protein family)
MGLIGALVVGGIAGYLAGKVMKSQNGIIINIILGIVGGVIGTFTLSLIGLWASGFVGEIVSSTLGAVILIFIGRQLFK